MKPAAITKATATAQHSKLRCDAAAIAAAITTALWLPHEPATAQGLGTARVTEPTVFMPGIRAAAVYSDNVLLAPKGMEDSDVIVEVTPSLTASSRSPRARYDLFYQMRNFWRVGENESTLARHALNANGSFALGDDRLWVDLNGYMGTLNTSVEGPIALDPGSSFVNVSNVRRFSVSPWFRDRLSDIGTYQVRYYAAHAGGDSDYALAKLDQRVSASIEGLGRASSPWNWSGHTEFQRRDYDGGISRNRDKTGVTLYYRVNHELRVFGTLDHEGIEGVRNRDGDESGIGPGAGFDWRPNTRTTVSASVSRRYYGTVNNAGATYRSARTTWGLQYSRSILTGSDASLLLYDPESITSGDLSGINPVLGSLIMSGLVLPFDPTLTPGVITDAAVLDRRLTAFYGLSGARNLLAVALYISNRESTTELTPTSAGGGIIGASPAGGVFAGELRERGLSATYRYLIDPRNSLSFNVDRRTNQSPTFGFDTRVLGLRLGYLLRVTRDVDAFGGIRRTRQHASGVGNAPYTENAIYIGTDVRFR